MTITAARLIEHQRGVVKADSARMEARPARYPRAAWRNEHPIANQHGFTVGQFFLNFDLNGSVTDLWVWKHDKVVERINLAASDADEKLSKYTATTVDPRTLPCGCTTAGDMCETHAEAR